MRIVVTGAAGFVGRNLCIALQNRGFNVLACILETAQKAALPISLEKVVTGNIDGNTDWRNILRKGDTVIHLAARVHVMHETSADPLTEFRMVNTAGTANLARQSAAAGVKRLVFMSTIGVNGNDSGVSSYTETDTPAPHNAYSVSKHEAEQELRRLSAQTGLEIVILRAPLVYGPAAPGNFLSLIEIVGKGLPLPLASICNRKSFLFVGNLVDAIMLCSIHSSAAGKTYLLSDGEDTSTPELIRRIAASLGQTARLFPFPPTLVRLAGMLTGKTAAVGRLLDSLTVDTTKIRKELGWKPPFTMTEGLIETAKWYKLRDKASQ